jgi:uncharacterized protein with HEPN domain
MSREWWMRVTDMIACCQRIRQYTRGLDAQAVFTDPMRYDAVLRNVQLIGEAARHLPDQVRQRLPEVPWREIIGTRNIVTHDYFGIDQNIIWDIVTSEVPALLEALERLSPHEPR